MTPVRLEPAAPRPRVKHSTTEPLRSLSLAVDIVVVEPDESGYALFANVTPSN